MFAWESLNRGTENFETCTEYLRLRMLFEAKRYWMQSVQTRLGMGISEENLKAVRNAFRVGERESEFIDRVKLEFRELFRHRRDGI